VNEPILIEAKSDLKHFAKEKGRINAASMQAYIRDHNTSDGADEDGVTADKR
jgi:hypothetical protein